MDAYRSLIARCALVAAALLGAAVPASGADRWISPTGSASWASATSSATPASMATANANAAAGDRIHALPGTYSTGFTPANSGTSVNRIVLMGAAGDSSAVILPSLSITGKSYITVKWMTFSSMDVSGSGTTAATEDSVCYVRVTGSVTTNGVQFCTFSNFTWGTQGSTSTKWASTFVGSQDACGVLATNAVVPMNNTFSDGTLYLGCVGPSANAWNASHLKQNTLSRLRVFFTVGADANNQSHPFIWYRCRDNVVTDSRFELFSSQSSDVYLFAVRDSSRFNVFLRDTFHVDTTGTGTGKVEFALSGSSTGGCWSGAGTNGYNAFRYCVFNIDGLFGYQNGSNRDSITHCTFYSSQKFVPQGDSLVVNHCTFYTPGALVWDISEVPSQQPSALTLRNSILFAGGGAGAPHWWASNRVLGTSALDYNLYCANALGDSTQVIALGTGGNSKVGPSGAHFTTYGFDQHSRFGDPVFASVASRNFTPGTSGNAVGAWWPDGYVGALAAAGPDTCLDTDRPGRVVDLVAAQVGASAQVTLTWPGESQFTGDGSATSWEIRRSASPITTLSQWNAATVIASANVEDVALPGESASWTVTVPDGVSYLAFRATNTTSGLVSCLSNTDSLTFTGPDVTPPATPFIQASYWRADGVRVVLSAPGDDGASGTATTYDLRYRLDPGTASAWTALSAVSQTYRVTGEPAPRAAGSADTIYVTGLKPGRAYWFALTASDEAANTSGISNVDSALVIARPVAAELPQPAFGIYGGAGFAETEPVIRPWSILCTDDGAAVRADECLTVSRFPVVSLEPSFADSAGPYGKRIALAAIQTLRAYNPAIKVLAEPVPDASYRRTTDTTNVYAYRFQKWRGARDGGGGWTSGGGFLWDLANPTWFNGTRPSGNPGVTLLNTNHAWQPSPGVFPVVDSTVAVYRRHFIERTHPDGSYVWDGLMMDLSNFGITQEGSIDYLRAGYADSLALDTAWVYAKHLLVRRLREAAVSAGRPDFILTQNAGLGGGYDHLGGFMQEGIPTFTGGTWQTLLMYTPGGAMNDAARFDGWRPFVGWRFRFTCTGDSCPLYNPDSVGSRQEARFWQGTSTLTGHTFVLEPSKASLAQGGGFHRYWFDEWAVDTLTGQAIKDAALTGWLGARTGSWYQTAPTIFSGGDRVLGNGGFEAGTLGAWTFTFSGPSGQASAAAVSDTVATGTWAARVRVGTKQDADWRASLTSNVYGHATNGATIVLSFKARASHARPVQAHVVNKSGTSRASWSTVARTWIGSGWTQYRLVGTATATDSIAPSFWCGDSSGTLYLDDVTLHVGGARGGSYVAPFSRGVVVVNPQSYADTITFGRAVRRLTALTGKNPDVNNGGLVLGSQSVIVPAGDARFLLWAADSLRPATPTIASAGAGRNWVRLRCAVAVGDDSLSGTVTSLPVRLRTDATAITDANWSSSTVASSSAVPVAGGLVQDIIVTGLTPGTTYRFAIRARDEAAFESPTSNSLTISTTTSLPVAVNEGK